jgi:hypothetical protein
MNPTTPLHVVALAGRTGLAHGQHAPEDPYVADVWLPVLGPASYVVWRQLARTAAGVGQRRTTLAALSAATGLGSPGGNQSGVNRALRRLQRFGLVHLDDDRVVVRTRLPFVTGRQLARLDPAIQATHRQYRTCDAS